MTISLSRLRWRYLGFWPPFWGSFFVLFGILMTLGLPLAVIFLKGPPPNPPPPPDPDLWWKGGIALLCFMGFGVLSMGLGFGMLYHFWSDASRRARLVLGGLPTLGFVSSPYMSYRFTDAQGVERGGAPSVPMQSRPIIARWKYVGKPILVLVDPRNPERFEADYFEARSDELERLLTEQSQRTGQSRPTEQVAPVIAASPDGSHLAIPESQLFLHFFGGTRGAMMAAEVISGLLFLVVLVFVARHDAGDYCIGGLGLTLLACGGLLGLFRWREAVRTLRFLRHGTGVLGVVTAVETTAPIMPKLMYQFVGPDREGRVGDSTALSKNALEGWHVHDPILVVYDPQNVTRHTADVFRARARDLKQLLPEEQEQPLLSVYDLQTLLKSAALAEKNGDFARAIEKYRTVVAHSGDNPANADLARERISQLESKLRTDNAS